MLASAAVMRVLGLVVLGSVIGCGGSGGAAYCPLGERSIQTGPTRVGPIVVAGPDADGDGAPDLVVGLGSFAGTNELGAVHLVSGATGEIIRTWTAEESGDRFGASVSLGPDADGDGLGDVIVGAPEHASHHGKVYLYSGGTGALIRAWDGDPDAGLGEHVALGPDLDGDGRGDAAFTDALTYDEWVEGGDILHGKHGHVHVTSGATGAERYAIAAAHDDETIALGAMGPDADGDGAADFLISAGDGVRLYSGATGAMLRTWSPEPGRYYFGTAVALGPDADGDGGADVAISSVDSTTPYDSHVVLYSGRTGATLHDWTVPNMRIEAAGIALAPDLDGDGRADVLVAAELAEEQADLVIWTAHAMSSGDGHDLASWQEVETAGHRDRVPTSITAAATACGARVAIGVNEMSADGPVASQVDLHVVP